MRPESAGTRVAASDSASMGEVPTNAPFAGSRNDQPNLSRWRMAAGNRTIAAGRAPVVQTGLPPMVWKNPVAYISTYETIYIKHLAFLRATHVGRVGNANPAGRRHRSRPK